MLARVRELRMQPKVACRRIIALIAMIANERLFCGTLRFQSFASSTWRVPLEEMRRRTRLDATCHINFWDRYGLPVMVIHVVYTTVSLIGDVTSLSFHHPEARAALQIMRRNTITMRAAIDAICT